MIVHLTQTYSRDLADRLDLTLFRHSLHPNQERSPRSFQNRQQLGDDSAFIDFEWHSIGDEDKAWVREEYSPRESLRSRSMDRRAFFGLLGELSNGPVLVPGGPPDRLSDALRHAREAAEELPNRDVWATVALHRASLTDPQVLMQMNQVHRDVSGIYLVVVDRSNFPGAWTPQQLTSYLRLVASQVLTGRRVVCAHADVRGLLAVALGASDLGTGTVKALRQYGAPSGGGGGQPGQPPPTTVSYLSLPILGMVHSLRAQTILGDGIGVVESHADCLPEVALSGLPASGEAWNEWNEPEGNFNSARGAISIRGIHAAERALVGANQPLDLIETWLQNAALLADGLPPEAFQSPGLRNEILSRPAVLQRVRAELGI